MNLLWCKVDANIFGFSNHHQDLDIKIVHIAMDACWDDRSKWEIYNEKIHKRARSVHYSKVLRTCLARGNIVENMCTFVYLFVVYFSFAPVILTSIHRYVSYFDIQVLTMVTETETLTSTLHHNKFNHFFIYVFLLPSYCRILIHIYFHRYIYILQNASFTLIIPNCQSFYDRVLRWRNSWDCVVLFNLAYKSTSRILAQNSGLDLLYRSTSKHTLGYW